MYSFEGLEYELSAERILRLKPDWALWRHYLGCDYELGRSIRAPYRIDRSPSFCLTYNMLTGKIIGRDYGKGGFHGDIFDYVQMIYKLDFYSALIRVNLDFGLGLRYSSSYKESKGVTKADLEALEAFQAKYDQQISRVQYCPRYFEEEDIHYWTQYGISSATLFAYHVHAAQKVWLNDRLLYTYKQGDPCYVYFFPKTPYRAETRAKCYWPARPQRRFITNASNDAEVQGYDQCGISEHKAGELLVLTKSMKDCMVFHEFGIDAMAPHGESQKLNADFVRHLRKYYKRIISLYDRDATGLKGARYLWKEYEIPPGFINKKYKCKDVSDLFKAHGKQVTSNFIFEL